MNEEADTSEGCRQIALRLVEGGCPESAIDWLNKARELDPNEIGLCISLGCVHMMLRCWQAAADSFQTVMAQEPTNIEALYGYGTASAHMGKLNESIVALERAKSLQNS